VECPDSWRSPVACRDSRSPVDCPDSLRSPVACPAVFVQPELVVDSEPRRLAAGAVNSRHSLPRCDDLQQHTLTRHQCDDLAVTPSHRRHIQSSAAAAAVGGIFDVMTTDSCDTTGLLSCTVDQSTPTTLKPNHYSSIW